MKLNLEWLSIDLLLEEFIPREATDELWQAYFNLSESIFLEFNPNARVPNREASKRLLSATSPLYKVQRTIVFDEIRTPVAFLSISYDTELSPSYEHDQHLCQVNVRIAKAFRRKGIALYLLKILLDTVAFLEKDTVQAEVENKVGKAFCKSLNGELVHEETQHRMYMEDVNWEIVEEWLAKGKEKFPDTTYELFRDCPDTDIEAFCETYTEIINERPTGEMEQTIITTPESRRVEEQNMKKKGIDWYTMISREKNGEISALTDLMHNLKEPHKIIQYFTGVSAKHRRKGLAKRIKAEMLIVIKKLFPDVEYITTTMAPNNRPMMAINEQLGFKSRKTTDMYQWALPDLLKLVDDHLSSTKKKRNKDCQKDSPL
ncbi:MAG: GNAT family N-acetyltransferase [Proteobacteria bacterium]|nr:GNAT family N-acetyltransferase [Pseudomonadota bacterium]